MAPSTKSSRRSEPRDTIQQALAARSDPLPNTASTQQLFNVAAAGGGRAWDHSGLVRALEIMAGGHEVRKRGDAGELLD